MSLELWHIYVILVIVGIVAVFISGSINDKKKTEINNESSNNVAQYSEEKPAIPIFSEMIDSRLKDEIVKEFAGQSVRYHYEVMNEVWLTVGWANTIL